MSNRHLFFIVFVLLGYEARAMAPNVAHVPVPQKIGAYELTLGLAANQPAFFNDLFFRCRRTIEKWLNRGADINCCSPEGHYTPLSFAALRGELRKCEILLELGADVNGAEADMTPMMAVVLCSENTRTKIFQLFIKHGADLNIRSKRTGETPIMRAVGKEFFIRDCPKEYQCPSLQDLLQLGANPFLGDINGNNALMYAAYYSNLRANRQIMAPPILKHTLLPKVQWFTFMCCLKRLRNQGTECEQYIASALQNNKNVIFNHFLRFVTVFSLRDALELKNNSGNKAHHFLIMGDIEKMLNPAHAKGTERMLMKEILGKNNIGIA